MNYDVVRGVLMVIVMLDHNDIVRNVRSVNQWFLPMTFHVAGFLLLPFIVRLKKLSGPMVRDHAIRYLTPFFFAVLFYAAAFHVVVAKDVFTSQTLGDVMAALVFADPWHLQVATGFIVLWFLPALLSVVLLMAMYDAVAFPWRAAILAVALLVHLAVGAVPNTFKQDVPQGFLIALYIFPLGVAMRSLLPFLTEARRANWIATSCAIALLPCWAFERGHEVEVATLVLPTLHEPLTVLATDVSDLGFLTLLIIGSQALTALPGLAVIGRYSLLVYLFHPIFYKPILGVFLHVARPGFLLYWAVAAASVAAVACASLVAAWGIQAWKPARKLITPRGLEDWKKGLLF